MVAVNELSNTIDLPSTLVRAEQLFRRFQRTVEAVDRKNHFPVPTNVRQRRPGQTDVASTESPASSSGREGAPVPAGAEAQGPSHRRGQSANGATSEDVKKEKVISPELRDLLRRDVFYKLNKSEVKQHGGGVGT